MRSIRRSPCSQHTVKVGSAHTVDNNCPETGNPHYWTVKIPKAHPVSFPHYKQVAYSHHFCLMQKAVSVLSQWYHLTDTITVYRVLSQGKAELSEITVALSSRCVNPCMIKFCFSDLVEDLAVLFNPCS